MLVPDYLNDLNAMHDAEKMLTPDQFMEYCHRLSTHHWPTGTAHPANGISANAAQRAEALLRTLNLWTNDA